MGLIYYDVLPFELADVVQTETAALKGGQTNVKLARQEMILEDVFPVLLAGDEVDHLDLRAPLGELIHPVGDGGLGHYDEMVAFDVFEFP